MELVKDCTKDTPDGLTDHGIGGAACNCRRHTWWCLCRWLGISLLLLLDIRWLWLDTGPNDNKEAGHMDIEHAAATVIVVVGSPSKRPVADVAVTGGVLVVDDVEVVLRVDSAPANALRGSRAVSTTPARHLRKLAWHL